jgi:hypothetical protein
MMIHVKQHVSPIAIKGNKMKQQFRTSLKPLIINIWETIEPNEVLEAIIENMTGEEKQELVSELTNNTMRMADLAFDLTERYTKDDLRDLVWEIIKQSEGRDGNL